jgi:hypothetical protein
MNRFLLAFLFSSTVVFAGTNIGPEGRVRVAIEAAQLNDLALFVGSVDLTAASTSNGPYHDTRKIVALLKGIDEKEIRFDRAVIRPGGTSTIRMLSPLVLNFDFRTGHNFSGNTFEIVAINP